MLTTLISDVLTEIQDTGILKNARVLNLTPSEGFWIEGTAEVADRDVHIRVGIDLPNVTRLPDILITPWDALGYIPHVGSNGLVCYKDEEGLVVSSRRPGAVAAWALGKAVGVLEQGARGENNQDFVDEFEACWLRLASQNGYYSYFNVLDPPGRSCMISIIQQGKRRFTTGSTKSVSALLRRDIGPHTLLRATCIVFPSGTYLEPPRPDRPFWTADYLRILVKPALDLLPRSEQKAMLRGKYRQSGTLIFVLPRPSPGKAMFAIGYSNGNGRHPLAPDGGNPSLYPIYLKRLERSYLVPRGGGAMDLSTKKALLIGCGAVGGHIAHELVRAGVLNVVLVDKDSFSADNTFRHVLGFKECGNKALEMKTDLSTRYPYLTVSAEAADIVTIVSSGSLQLSHFDVIVAATGSPTIEMWLNKQLYQTPHAPPTIFTWVEPYGIGGHAVLTHPVKTGCLECLYTWVDPANNLKNQASFAAPDQNFGRALSGCGTLHTPYGSLDASRTANVAVRLALDVLTHRETNSLMRSWKGDASDFLAAGFRLSERYATSEEVLNRKGRSYASPHCPICAESHEST